MVWYVAVLAAVAATFYAYRQRRSIHRMGNDEVGDLARLLGTDFGVAFCGSIALLLVLLFVLLSNPSGAVIKETARSREIEDFKLLGNKIAIRVAAAMAEKKSTAGKPWEALIIAREAGKKGQPYHDATIDAIKKGLDGKVQKLEVELVPNTVEGLDSEQKQTRLLTVSNEHLDQICSKHRTANVVICLLPVHYNFTESLVAQETRGGQKIFALYTDNVYQLGDPISYDEITFCITDNPLFRPEKLAPEAKAEERYNARYLPPIGKNNIRALAGKYRKLFYTTKRLD